MTWHQRETEIRSLLLFSSLCSFAGSTCYAALSNARRMSLNLTVPLRDSPTTRERSATAKGTPRRAKSPAMPRMAHPNRAKSKSPNPSFCSVLSRVKDWELGAFTPKTALADNVDVMNRSNVPFSDSDREMSDQGESKPGSDLAGPWPSGSPPRELAAGVDGVGAAAAAAAAGDRGKAGGGGGGGAGAAAAQTTAGAGDKNCDKTVPTSRLEKSTLSSNIGKRAGGRFLPRHSPRRIPRFLPWAALGDADEGRRSHFALTRVMQNYYDWPAPNEH